MSDRPSAADSTTSSAPARAGAPARHGVEDKLALALVLPLLAGVLVAAFLPWPAWSWVGMAAAGLLTAAVVWLWLRRTVVRPVRVLTEALDAGRTPDAKDLRGGGELAGLADAVQAALARQRRLERDLDELTALRFCVGRLATGIDAWTEREERPAFAAASAEADEPDDDTPEAARPLLRGLRRALEQLDARAGEARVVAGLVRESVDDARVRGEALSGGAERQFVEATSLLTVLRELRRWAGELAPALESLRAAAAARVGEDGAGGARWSHLVDEALEGATTSLAVADRAAQRLATSAEDVLEFAESARLTRIEAAAAALGGVPEAATFVDALESFGRDTAALRERIQGVERAIRDDLAGARDELAGHEARVRAEARDLATVTQHPGLAGAPLVPRGVDPAVGARRSLDRVHEMVAEALARGEKLVQQAERTSSEALRAGESMQVALDEIDGLRARLEPSASMPAPDDEGGSVPEVPSAPEGEFEPALDPAAPPMRVLGPADVLEDDDDLGLRG